VSAHACYLSGVAAMHLIMHLAVVS